MSNLFNITERYLTLLNDLEDSIMENDVPDDDIVEALNITEKEAKDKIRAYYYFIKQKQAESQLIDDEVERLKSLKESKENVVDRLKQRVNEALKLFGESGKSGNQKMDLGDLKLWNVYNKPVVVDDEFNNPKYCRYSISLNGLTAEVAKVLEAKAQEYFVDTTDRVKSTPDKKALKEVLTQGVEVDGARIDTTASFIVFK